MRRPPQLKSGDRIRLVAPARKVSRAEMQPALDQIKAWGFEAFYTTDLWAEENQFAGADEVRIRDFQAALDDPKCKAILCVRGGYGSVRLIDFLNFDEFEKHPKWIVGYSDPTVFHLSLHQRGWASLHASMPINFATNSEKSLLSIYQALSGESYEIQAKPHDFNRLGTSQGEIIGGNLSMIYSLLGSPSSVDTQGKILFLEDLDEYLYHLDRMMWNLKRNGYFERIKALLVGTMSDMNDNLIPFGESAEEIIHRHLKDYDFPVAFGIPAGHQKDNQCLIFGSETYLEIGQDRTLIRFQNESQSRTGQKG